MGNLRLSVYLFIVANILFFTGLTVYFYKFPQPEFYDKSVHEIVGKVKRNKVQNFHHFVWRPDERTILSSKIITCLIENGYTWKQVVEINDTVLKHKNTHAYVSWSEPLPLDDLIRIAIAAIFIFSENECDRYIAPSFLVAIQFVEMINRVGVGGCVFVEDRTYNRSLIKKGRIKKAELIAFKEIFASINRHLRHPRYHMQMNYPTGSCGAGAMGPMQIMPVNWKYYQRQVCDALCEMLDISYTSPYHLVHANVGANALLRDSARIMRLLVEEVNLANPDVVELLAAAYYAGPRKAKFYVNSYGRRAYRMLFTIKQEFYRMYPQQLGWRGL